MADANSSESPLETAAGVAGPSTTDAFAVLGNETRLSILLALWEEFEPYSEDTAVSFSELRDRIGMRDSGQFNYHLDKLTEHFVRATDAGYELLGAGQNIVRTVIAGTGLEDTTVSPTELDLSCHRCGATPVQLSYQDESLFLTCPDCEGFTGLEEFPTGTLAVWDLDPAGLANRNPAQRLLAGAISANKQLEMMMEGVCPDCSGTIDTSLQLCAEHPSDPGEVCPNCGMRDSARVRYICTVCKQADEVPVQTVVHDHPAVISFYYDHDVDLTYDIDDIEGFFQIWRLLWKQEHSIVSMDPVEILVTIPCEGDELNLRLNESLTVVDVSTDD